ncbi:MAG: hypothetical protein IJZ84_02460 [Lachnospiraceae bacterium]|nr:hypothetical protein [Lachnospiraceae bacterium]
MKKKDKGSVQTVLVLILLTWLVWGFCILMTLMKAGYVNRYIEDCLMQANLAAILIDPYHYGSTGELVFENTQTVRNIFNEVLSESLGDAQNREKLGIGEEILVSEFRIYEVTTAGTTEFIYDSQGILQTKRYDSVTVLEAPDGTVIQNSSLYARIEVPIKFMLGIEVRAIKEHCVDIKSEG